MEISRGGTIHLHRDKTFVYITHREKERQFLLQRIQIYLGDVLPNMQDLFMSVSISASHLQTQSTASTLQYSGAYSLCHTHGDSLIV